MVTKAISLAVISAVLFGPAVCGYGYIPDSNLYGNRETSLDLSITSNSSNHKPQGWVKKEIENNIVYYWKDNTRGEIWIYESLNEGLGILTTIFGNTVSQKKVRFDPEKIPPCKGIFELLEEIDIPESYRDAIITKYKSLLQ